MDLCSSSSSSSSDQEAQACLLFINIRTGPSLSSQPAGGEAKLQQIMQIQTRYICSASELIGHGVLKKGAFFSCVCSLTVQSVQSRVCVYACVHVFVCVDHPKAACAPLFQMTLFTDITQPPRNPRQNLISREHHSRDRMQREIFASRLQTCAAFH